MFAPQNIFNTNISPHIYIMMVIIETIPPTETPTEETDPLAGIIGGSVAGVVLLSAAIAAIMILFILKCVTRRSV